MFFYILECLLFIQYIKMKYLLYFLIIPGLYACNLSGDRKLSEQELKDLAKAHNDSVMVVVDSLMKVNIYVPPLYEKELFDSTTTETFFDLARSTGGELKLLVNSQLLSNEIIHIIKTYSRDNADLLFLVDKTGSMIDDIEFVKLGLQQIIEALSGYKNLRLAIALYGDKNADGPAWFSFKNFETDYKQAENFIAGIEVTSGFDYPESVYDGFFKACEQNFWKSENKRMIILIGDAPPLEKPLSEYALGDMIKKAQEYKISMNFYPIVVTPTVVEMLPVDPTVKTYEQDTLITGFYPNPASSDFHITLKETGQYDVELYAGTGSRMLTESFTGNLWNKDLSGLANGAYIIRVIRKDKKFETRKLVIYR